MSNYIVKKAELQLAARNPYRPRQTLKRGAWVVLGTFPTLDEATSAWEAAKRRSGLAEYAIFHDGKKIQSTR